jgi:hypothetical protein
MPTNSKMRDFGGQGALVDRLALVGYLVTSVDINVDDFRGNNDIELLQELQNCRVRLMGLKWPGELEMLYLSSRINT